MKKKWILMSAVGCILSASLFSACSPQPAKPMHSTVSQLDLDGDFLLFADTSTIEKNIMDSIDETVALITGPGGLDAKEKAETEAVVASIKDGIRWSGLLAPDSFAVSTKTLKNGLTRSISIIELGEGDGQKAVWRVLTSEPVVLKGIQYAPADAILTINSTASLNELWKACNEGLETYFPAETGENLAQQIVMIETMLGANLDDLLGSLENEILVSIQLSESKTSTFPGASGPMTIPEPSLLIGLQTRDASISELILAKLQEAGAPTVTSTHGDFTLNTLNLPIPMPCPVAPTLVQTENYLLIGSNPDVITQALDSHAGQSGLIATPAYKKLLGDAPEKTSGIEFVSPRFMQTYMEIMTQMMGAGGDAESAFLLESMFGEYKDMASGEYTLKTPSGLYSESYTDNAVNPLEMLVNMYFKAITGAVAIPLMSGNKGRAMATEGQAGCATISTYIRMYQAENGSLEGIQGLSSLSGLRPGDLDGTYFNDTSYTIKVIDDQTYTVTAIGTGKAAGVQVVLTVKNGRTSWEIRNP